MMPGMKFVLFDRVSRKVVGAVRLPAVPRVGEKIYVIDIESPNNDRWWRVDAVTHQCDSHVDDADMPIVLDVCESSKG